MGRGECWSSQPMAKLFAPRLQRSSRTLILLKDLEKKGANASNKTFRVQRWWERCCACTRNALREVANASHEIAGRAQSRVSALLKRTKRRTAFSPCDASNPL